MATKKKRLRTDFNMPKTLRLHKDGVKAMDSLANRFRGQYVKKELATYAIMILDKLAKERGVHPGESIEEAFGI